MPEIPKRERALEKVMRNNFRDQGARIRHFYEIGPQQPYDGMFGFWCFSFSYEAKHSTNKVRHSFKSWRNGPRGHQFDELKKDYINKSCYPFKIIYWEPAKDNVTYKVALMPQMIRDSMSYKSLRTVYNVRDIALYCLEVYGRIII